MKRIIDNINKKRIIVVYSLILSFLFLFLWVHSGNFNIGRTESTVYDYTSWDSLLVKGYEVQDKCFTKEKDGAYIVIPQGDIVDRLSIELMSSDSDGLSARVYFSDSNGDFVTDKSLKKVFKDNNVSYNLPSVPGPFKIKFEGNDNAIQLNKISLYKSEMVLNRHLVIIVLLAFVVVFIAFTLLIDLLDRYSKNDLNYFYLTIVIGLIFFVLINCCTNSYYWNSYFFANPNGAFMDHFSMLFVARGVDPYSANASYPAICFIILKFINNFIPETNQAINSADEIRGNSFALSVFIFAILICILAIFIIIKKINVANASDIKVALMLLTGPMLYVIQRGNILLLAFVFILLYLYFYDSDDKRLRYISYIALAIAASIKIYPAVFGLMTVRKKRYKDAIVLAILGAMVFIIPFFAYDGVASIRGFLHGLAEAGESMTAQGVGYNISLDNIFQTLNLALGIHVPSSSIMLIIVNIVLVVLALRTYKEWHAWFLLATICAWYPVFSFTYVVLMFYPAILVALRDDDSLRKTDYILFGIMLTPLALPYIKRIDEYVVTTNFEMGLSFSTVILNLIIIYWVIRIAIEVFFKKNSIELAKKRVLINRILSILLVVLTVFIFEYSYVRPFDRHYKFAGLGTPNNPYQISSIEDYLYLVEKVNSGETFAGAYFIQTADIQFDGKTSIDPLGWGDEDKRFSGVYNGQGYSVIDFYTLSDDDENMGLFGVLDGQVYNLNIKNCNIAGNIVGGIAYEVTSKGRIENCYVNGIVYGYQAGGIAAINHGTIKNCVSFVNIDATDIYGVSENMDGAVTINNYSNNNKWNGVLNADTIAVINSHVVRMNNALFNPIELCSWTTDQDYFMLVNVKE